ncbi:MAG: inositol monophosphatase family protein [Candidatus Zixiibacteriota bacterium]
MTPSELRAATQFACRLARDAAGVLKRGFTRARRITYKGRIDPVTEFDLKAERLITARISRAFPDHEILTEEGSARGKRSEYLWIVDPLDGTVNYAHGFPVYCVSIALQHVGRTVVAAVCDPERDELFWSARGLPARLNRRQIKVSAERRLDRALLATGFAYDIGTARRNNLGLFARMARKAQGIRRPGSAALDLCWLACGRIDGFWELKLHPWDTAAAILIVENAGGRISRVDGRPYSVFDQDLLATNGLLHRQMRSILTSR